MYSKLNSKTLQTSLFLCMHLFRLKTNYGANFRQPSIFFNLSMLYLIDTKSINQLQSI